MKLNANEMYNANSSTYITLCFFIRLNFDEFGILLNFIDYENIF